MINYYICAGLGVWLSTKSVLYSNPSKDLSAVLEIVNFFLTLFLWPISIVGNYLISHEMRKMNLEIDNLLKTSLDAPECPINKNQEKDKE